ncbi:hypothetical protein VKT23_012835 [Stygiomarasmius scandens]|uniref:Uncharacterized protein n=1 Tax=Marasmiellus scandens TaxID=2682957 RepID=A0ABR1J4Z6_9AGAR
MPDQKPECNAFNKEDIDRANNILASMVQTAVNKSLKTESRDVLKMAAALSRDLSRSLETIRSDMDQLRESYVSTEKDLNTTSGALTKLLSQLDLLEDEAKHSFSFLRNAVAETSVPDYSVLFADSRRLEGALEKLEELLE